MSSQSAGLELSLDDALGSVRTFHRRIGAPVVEKPALLRGHAVKALAASILVGQLRKELLSGADGDQDVVLCRAAMALEELREWLFAHANSNLVDVADALADRFYLLLGDAVATGLPLTDLFQEVHKSNLSKLAGVHTGVGKAVKGRGYERPQIEKVLAAIGRPN